MDKLKILLQDNLNIEFRSAVLSNPRQKDIAEKIKVRPLLSKEKLIFQIETFRNHQAFHRNVEPGEACMLLLKEMENMRQLQMETAKCLYTILVSKKGKVTVKVKRYPESVRIQPAGEPGSPGPLSHNRKKHYILEEGIPVPFLVDFALRMTEGRHIRTWRRRE